MQKLNLTGATPRLRVASLAMIGTGLLAVPVAHAEESSTTRGTLEEIIVTAQKRA